MSSDEEERTKRSGRRKKRADGGAAAAAQKSKKRSSKELLAADKKRKKRRLRRKERPTKHGNGNKFAADWNTCDELPGGNHIPTEGVDDPGAVHAGRTRRRVTSRRRGSDASGNRW